MSIRSQQLILVKVINFLSFICNIECHNAVYGCLTCSESSNSFGTYVVCSECFDGLYLLSNITRSSYYPSYYGYCVEDCRKAHSAYINDPNLNLCQCKYLN